MQLYAIKEPNMFRFAIASTGLVGKGTPFKTSNVKIIINAGEKVAFIRPDGYFALCAPTELVQFTGRRITKITPSF